MSPSVHIIIVAAGTGSRFGGTVPKQFCLLDGRPVLMHTIGRMHHALPDASLTVVLSPAMTGLWEQLCREHGFVSPPVIPGGDTRSDSVRHAVLALDHEPDIILVHDGARPLASDRCIRATVQAIVPGVDGAIPATPVTDSLRRIMPDGPSQAVDRDDFRSVQTPQAFSGPELIAAYRSCGGSFSDDASIMQHCGHTNIVLTPGEPSNIKITNPIDLAIAEILLHQE